MRELNDGDVICYADSGIAYLRNVGELVEKLRESRQDIMLFEIPLIECQWTRKSVLQALDAYTETIRFSNQTMGTIIIIIISKYSRNFIQKWLELCQNADLIFPKEKDAAEDNLYVAHREDQSILSVLAKKEGIIPFSDPTDYGKFPYQYLSANRLFRINKREKPYQLEHIYMLLPRKANPYIYFAKICLKTVLKKLNLIIRR